LALTPSRSQAELLTDQTAASLEQLVGKGTQGNRRRLLGVGLDQRYARVTGCTQLRVEWYLSE
jgi:hypothetical protein